MALWAWGDGLLSGQDLEKGWDADSDPSSGGAGEKNSLDLEKATFGTRIQKRTISPHSLNLKLRECEENLTV